MIKGTVVTGAGRGARILKTPTANFLTKAEVIPRDGVYAVRVMLGGKLLDGVANLGKNPTFPGASGGVEVHLLDYDGDIYGKPLRVYFMHRLREEKTFSGPQQLVEAIEQDVIRARQLLATSRLVVYHEYLGHPGERVS